MDTQKLHDLIDKVIGKDGPLRTPAYWMRRVLNGIIGRIDEKAKEVKSEIDNELKGKLDRAIPLTYKEFRNMCYKKAGIEGQYYHISDYKPTLSELQEGFNVNPFYEGKLYVKYNEVKILNQFRDFCDTIFKGYVFTDEKTYEVDYILHDGFDALGNKWMMGPFESFDSIVVTASDVPEVLNNLTLRNKASIEGKSEWWLFEDALTQEEYEVWNYHFESNELSLSLRKVGDSMIYHDVKIVDYTFRTYGSILRMKDCTQNLEVCYDFIGLSSRETVRNFSNSKITGYYSGFLPRVTGGTSYVIDGVEIINSDNIRLSGDYQMYSTKLRIVECHDVYCSACDNVVLDSCYNVSISKAKDCYFIWCHDIESTTQLYSSRFMSLTSKKIEYVYNSFLYSVDADEISNVIGIGFDDVIGKHVVIKDGQMYTFYKNKSYYGYNPVYPKTTTQAVVDEATGKTLAEILGEMGTSGGGDLIKVIDFSLEWADGQEHDIGMTWDEYVAVPKIIFRLDLGEGLYSTLERFGMSSDGDKFSDLYLGRQRTKDLGGEWSEARVVLQVYRKDGMAVVQALDGTSMVLPAFSLGRQDKMIDGLGDWVDFVPKADYDAEIAKIIGRLNALEGK